MAEKHKSKYKSPKDLEKSQKPKPRKDLKDYTEEDKAGALNPKTTGEKQKHVIRKTDKEIQDDGKMFPKYDADDRLYKDLEDGEYDPKDAAKKMEKRQKATEKDLKDKLDNLTVEQRERVVREYIRRKISRVLQEQAEDPLADPAAEPAAPVDPAADPMADPAAATDMPVDTGMDMGGGGAAAAPPAPAPPADIDTSGAPAPTTDNTTETPDLGITTKDLDKINQGGTITKVKGFNQLFDAVVDNSDPEDARSFYKMIAKLAAKKFRGVSEKK